MPRTAKNGKADWSLVSAAGAWTDIPEVRTISMTPSTEAKEYASSSTAGAKKRLEGIDDVSGSVEIYIDPDNRFDAETMGLRTGASGWFRFYEARTDDPFIVPVYIDSIDYNVAIEGGDIIGATINYSGNGQITYPE